MGGQSSPLISHARPMTTPTFLQVDLFSLGSVMYELISLQMPFESQGTPELMFKGSRPPLLSKVCHQCWAQRHGAQLFRWGYPEAVLCVLMVVVEAIV